jgi:PadR family transcriptional regulator, regulatory protein PadR
MRVRVEFRKIDSDPNFVPSQPPLQLPLSELCIGRLQRGCNVAGSDLFTGSLDLLLLKALSWGPMHGYAVARWIRVSTREGLTVREGALYPALHRLQAKGFLTEEWGITDTNREAKFYRLTPAGRKQLAAELARWREYSRMMNTALATSRNGV